MIAVDTNVVVRLLTQDDEQQYNKSRNCSKMYTFDTKFVSRAKGLTESEVQQLC